MTHRTARSSTVFGLVTQHGKELIHPCLHELNNNENRAPYWNKILELIEPLAPQELQLGNL